MNNSWRIVAPLLRLSTKPGEDHRSNPNDIAVYIAGGFDAGIRLAEYVERDMVGVRLTEPFRFVIVGARS